MVQARMHGAVWRRIPRKRALAIRGTLAGLLALGAIAQVGCSDVGDDNFSPPVGDFAADAASESDATADGAIADAAAAREAAVDPGVPRPDGSAVDAALLDATVLDSAVADATLVDGVAPDGAIDATVLDANPRDSGGFDSTLPADGGVPDAGATGDSAVGTLDDGGSFDSLCEQFNLDAGCTPTELLFLEHDPSGTCYSCLAGNSGLDDNLYGDTGHECSDLTGNASAGAEVGVSRQALCLRTLSCILGPPETPTCATEGQPDFCYCGSGVGPAACSALTSAPMGQCTQEEADGFELPASGPTAVLKAYVNTSFGSGMANQIINIASANDCTTCF